MRFFRYWLPPALWMLCIFLLSGRPSTSVSQDQLINFLFFKTLHVLEYAFLYLLMFRALKYSKPKKNPVVWFTCAFLLTVLYAVTDEIHQLFVPTREGRMRDVIIDGLGAAIAWISINKLLPKAPGKLRRLAASWQLL